MANLLDFVEGSGSANLVPFVGWNTAEVPEASPRPAILAAPEKEDPLMSFDQLESFFLGTSRYTASTESPSVSQDFSSAIDQSPSSSSPSSEVTSKPDLYASTLDSVLAELSASESTGSQSQPSGVTSPISKPTSRRKKRTLPLPPVSPTSSAGSPVSAGHLRFNCPECPQKFRQRNHIQLHLNAVHRKLKPFDCPHCDRAFGTGSNLRRHIRMVHEKIRPYACPVCDYAFCEPGDMKKHIYRRHKGHPAAAGLVAPE
eukprot:CAMPEP_0198309914 /NCGR_PEP_ID=MMETSP1450-20131203/2147_1 /TAXON_ID=753684 ORGANISM="Madagascaria erythrocladiodes, Strain CCMP3234" /NCGR_SAMPLE_ID=MMETSP1450 /ASSEMBLY_ACC=CAM_ASM_001115 /LENGTH=257 /DNA_ID=CAMNT_0044012697 /DNA_START=176 /DNA_END=949 /DNA_ORIENTATION=-